MYLNHAELRDACYVAAQKTMMDARPTDVLRIQKLADNFFTICLDHINRVNALGRDPNIVVRAAKYLAETHAIQPMHDSTEWFFFMLRALLELSCPEMALSRNSYGFYKDIEEGLALARCRLEER